MSYTEQAPPMRGSYADRQVPYIPPESISVDPETGGRKATKLADFSLVPPHALWLLAEHYGKGAEKYDRHNWALGYDWSKSYAAAQRHLHQFWMGEDVDPETGSLHTVAAAWHCITLTEFQSLHPSKDDRLKAVLL